MSERAGAADGWDSDLANTISVHRAYDLNGVTLGVAASDERHAAFLDPILAPLRCATPTPCDWLVRMSPVPAVDAPPGGARVFEGPLPEGLPSVMVQERLGRTLVVPSHFAMQFRRAACATDIRFVPGKEWALGGTAAFWMLADLLAARERHLLHGALLVDPTTDHSIVLFAPSGTGKTTTSLALARSGLCFGGDDALVLASGQGDPFAWAIPRPVKVDRRAAALLPWLKPTVSDHWIDDEQPIRFDALSRLVEMTTPRPRKVGLVVALQAPNARGHAVASISKPDALTAIAIDNLRVAPGGVDPDNAAALAALARLVAMTPVVTLSVGPDPTSLAGAIFGLR